MRIEGDWVYYDRPELPDPPYVMEGDQYQLSGLWLDYSCDLGLPYYERNITRRRKLYHVQPTTPPFDLFL